MDFLEFFFKSRDKILVTTSS